MIFEELPTVPRSEELIDQAFSRAARAGRAKSGHEAQQSMLQTASNVLSDNLRNVVTAWPDFDEVHPFYFELADAITRDELPGETGNEPGDGVSMLRQALSELSWASRKSKELGREYQRRLPGDIDAAIKVRKQGFARMADVVREIDDELAILGSVRDLLRDLPDIRPEEPTIVVAGYPNVGKSSFVNAVTNARNETASYPFTTRGIDVGHVEREHIRFQLVDTPGLLDRPPEERNEIESQAVSALGHLADTVVVMVDPSATCGYPIEVQLELRDAIREQFSVPVLTVANKADLAADVGADRYGDVEADLYTVATGEEIETEGRDETAEFEVPDAIEAVSVDEVVDTAVEVVDYEPELPFEG